MNFHESSMEFDLFEDMRLKLTRALVGGGREELEAERIALYVMQGVREVPALLNALASDHTNDGETRRRLQLVLDNAVSLDRARTLLLGVGDEPLH
jgi:hypothetical protein